jgi:hypothetical protein
VVFPISVTYNYAEFHFKNIHIAMGKRRGKKNIARGGVSLESLSGGGTGLSILGSPTF